MRIGMFAFASGPPSSMVTGISLSVLLSGCGSGSGAAACPPAQVLSVVGYSTGSTPVSDGLATDPSPYPITATYLYFSVRRQPASSPNEPPTVTGIPILKGSDGSSIAAGSVVPVVIVHITPILFGYASSISGLKPNVTYSVSFASLTGVPSGCSYGAQAAGSFQTSS